MYRQPRPRRQNVLSRDVIRTYVNISAKSTEISAIVPSFPVIFSPTVPRLVGKCSTATFLILPSNSNTPRTQQPPFLVDRSP